MAVNRSASHGVLELTVLVVFPAEGGKQPQTISETPYRKNSFHFAPDGRTVLYVSEESTSNQVSVASFPSFAEKRQISIDGGVYPFWRKDGRKSTSSRATVC